MRGILLIIVSCLLHFVFIESKICPKCQLPSFLATKHPMHVVPKEPLNKTRCLYPQDIIIHSLLENLTKINTPVCVYIVPLRDDYLKFYFPTEHDAYFKTFWKENGERCLKYYDSEVLGFYNFDKYGNLPTDILYSCSRGFDNATVDNREDQLNVYLSQLMLSYIQEMEGKPSHRLMRCYDRDTDLVNSHWTLYNCMFAVMNRTFSVGPLSFNSFFVDQMDGSADFSHLKNTFLSAQASQEGCAIADVDATGRIQILNSITPSNFLDDGECTGTLNLYGFDLLCCCYLNALNCLYTASPYSTEYDPTTQNLEGKVLRDDQFLCIKGSLNSSTPELKFRGPRKDILTDLAPQCYTLLNITYDKDFVFKRLTPPFLRQNVPNIKDTFFSLSITFGAALGMDSNICNETDVGDKTANAYPYLKSPWGFHSVYNVQQEPIEIVRCCKGNFCNHFGMFGDDKTDAWPTKFQFKMNEDWKMKCGYLPIDIFWFFFKDKNTSYECLRALSEEKVPEIQSFLGGRDFVKNPLYRAVPRKDANFTGLLPFEPMFCFYGGIPYSQAFNRSGMIYAPRMVFGCQMNESFKIDFTASPEFNYQVQLYQQNVLRELKKQFLPFSTCHSTNGASIELLSFLRSNKKEKLVWFPICFAMIYRDFHQTFYRSGACALGESCCDFDYWTKSFFDLDKHNYNATTKTYEGKPYENSTEHVYKCTSPWCVSDEMDARCFFYSGKEYTAAEIVSKLNYGNFSNDMYPQRMGRSQVSLSVDSITGYNPSNFNQNKRKREFTAIDTYCTASDSCFANDSIFYQSHVSSAFPFCIWSTQRQYGADYSREVVVADASNKPDRIRFELGCKFDNGKSTAIKQLTSTADATDDDYQRKVLKSSKNRSSKKDL